MSNYIHGHHESVLRAHSWRTAQNSCAYMLPYLETLLQSNPKPRVLDVGCGPGTITCDLASIYPSINITGIDHSQEVVDQATTLAKSKALDNADFSQGNIFALTYPHDTFDVIHVHQVIQHIPNPVNGLRELHRVLKPGGFLAIREIDHEGTRFYPVLADLEEWFKTFYQVSQWTGGTKDMGRRVHALLREAGFSGEPEKMNKGASTWCFTSKGDRDWWSSLWYDRALKSQFAHNAISSGLCKDEDLQRYADAWIAWGSDEDGWMTYIHGEVVAFK